MQVVMVREGPGLCANLEIPYRILRGLVLRRQLDVAGQLPRAGLGILPRTGRFSLIRPDKDHVSGTQFHDANGIFCRLSRACRLARTAFDNIIGGGAIDRQGHR